VREYFSLVKAGIAQLVEQLICNQQVVGSNPTAGSLSDCGLRNAGFGLGAAAVSPTEKPMTREIRLLFQATRGIESVRTSELLGSLSSMRGLKKLPAPRPT
jgi:hypothetical protein